MIEPAALRFYCKGRGWVLFHFEQSLTGATVWVGPEGKGKPIEIRIRKISDLEIISFAK